MFLNAGMLVRLRRTGTRAKQAGGWPLLTSTNSVLVRAGKTARFSNVLPMLSSGRSATCSHEPHKHPARAPVNSLPGPTPRAATRAHAALTVATQDGGRRRARAAASRVRTQPTHGPVDSKHHHQPRAIDSGTS